MNKINLNEILSKKYILGRHIGLFQPDAWGEIDPVSSISLLAEGQLTNNAPAKFANERSWRPFVEGFQFMRTDEQRGVLQTFPTSSWFGQDSDGVLFGRYNSLGIFNTLPHALRLVPDVTVSKNTNFVVVIATCEKFYQKTVPHLISQLEIAGFAPHEIKVVVNGSQEWKKKKDVLGVEYVYTKHNAWEMSAYHEIHHFKFDYALVIHDTVQVSENLRENLYKLNGAKKWDVYPLVTPGFLCMSVISYDYAERIKEFVAGIDGITKQQGVYWEVSGGILHGAKSAYALQTASTVRKEKAALIKGGIKRQVHEIKSLGITKYMNIHSFEKKTEHEL